MITYHKEGPDNWCLGRFYFSQQDHQYTKFTCNKWKYENTVADPKELVNWRD